MKPTLLRMLAGAALSVALSSCSGSTQNTSGAPAPTPSLTNTLEAQPVPTGTSGQPRGQLLDPGTINTADADAVATAAVETMYRYDSAIDNSPMDASRRAQPWLTSDYAAAVAKPLPGGGGADWITLAQHHGYTTTSVKDAHDDGAPPDDPTHVSRQRVVTLTPHGDNGWTAQPAVVTVFVNLVRQSTTAPWQVNGVTTA